MKCLIERHESLEGDYRHLIVQAPAIAANAEPGQFLMIKVVTEQYDPLLRRPVSIMDVHESGAIELLYRIVGKGTRLLSQWSAGSSLDIIGPLGNGFKPRDTGHSAILVGGGVGIPPLIFLAHTLQMKKSGQIFAFLGGKTTRDLPFRERFTQYGADLTCITEEGEEGRKGRVTDPLISFLDSQMPPDPVIYACGPDPMLNALQKIAKKKGVPGRFSLEEHMACGVGACLGCVVQTRNGFKRICHDGPVFDADSLQKWDR